MSMTIKELADELGVSKSKIKYQVAKLSSDLTTKSDNVIYLSDTAITIIKREIGGYQKRNDRSFSTDFFVTELEKRDQELTEKNKQLETLLTNQTQLQKLLDQQQVLTLQANQKILALETSLEKKDESPAPGNSESKSDLETKKNVSTEHTIPPAKKKGFFSRWF